jgi:hypothetical protein
VGAAEALERSPDWRKRASSGHSNNNMRVHAGHGPRPPSGQHSMPCGVWCAPFLRRRLPPRPPLRPLASHPPRPPHPLRPCLPPPHHRQHLLPRLLALCCWLLGHQPPAPAVTGRACCSVRLPVRRRRQLHRGPCAHHGVALLPARSRADLPCAGCRRSLCYIRCHCWLAHQLLRCGCAVQLSTTRSARHGSMQLRHNHQLRVCE